MFELHYVNNKLVISSNENMPVNGTLLTKEEQNTIGYFDIDMSNLCAYDERNPHNTFSDDDKEYHKEYLSKKRTTCSCDDCFYGRTELTEQLIELQNYIYNKIFTNGKYFIVDGEIQEKQFFITKIIS